MCLTWRCNLNYVLSACYFNVDLVFKCQLLAKDAERWLTKSSDYEGKRSDY